MKNKIIKRLRDLLADENLAPFGPDEPHVWPDDSAREIAADLREMLKELDA